MPVDPSAEGTPDDEVFETTTSYTERVAGEYFSRDANMNLLFHAIGSIIGQLGETYTGVLDTMFVPDGSKAVFNTYLTGMPPTANTGTIVGFMDPAFPWWFSMEVRTYNAVPDVVFNAMSGVEAGELNASELAAASWDGDIQKTTQFVRLELEDVEEWYPDWDPGALAGEEYVYIDTNTTLASWNWGAASIIEYPSAIDAPNWRAMGAKSIAYTDAANWISQHAGFSTASHFMSFLQTSQLTNWFDTVVSSDVLLDWASDAVSSAGTDLSSYGYQSAGAGTAHDGGSYSDYDNYVMTSIDENMVLDLEDVDSIATPGMLGTDRTNPYQTSTYDPESFTADPDDGENLYVASTSSEVIEDLKIRYKQLITSKTTAADFIEAQSILIESTLYSSIGMKRYITKMQRSTAMTNPYTISGDPSAVSRASVTTLDTNAATTIEEAKSSAITTTLDSADSGYGGY
jgi:hypothetical protein